MAETGAETPVKPGWLGKLKNWINPPIKEPQIPPDPPAQEHELFNPKGPVQFLPEEHADVAQKVVQSANSNS